MLDESSHDINEISNEDNVMGSLKTISSLVSQSIIKVGLISVKN
jgi:hypothetical protein